MQLKKLKRLAGALLILTGLNACTTNTSGNYCLLYEPIYADYDNDTAETIRQIDRNNVVYEAVCNQDLHIKFTNSWEQRKLADTVKIRTGFPFDSSKFSDDGEFLVITNGNIKDEFSDVDDSLGNRINIQNNQIKQEYELTTDDILVTMDGTVGRTAKVVDSKQILAQRVGRLTATENKEFLYQALNTGSFFNEMSILSHGGTIKHISLSEIGSFEFSAPTKLLEQQKIGTFFSNLDNLITLHQRKRKLLNKTRKRTHNNIHIFIFQLMDDMQISFLRCRHTSMSKSTSNTCYGYSCKQEQRCMSVSQTMYSNCRYFQARAPPAQNIINC